MNSIAEKVVEALLDRDALLNGGGVKYWMTPQGVKVPCSGQEHYVYALKVLDLPDPKTSKWKPYSEAVNKLIGMGYLRINMEGENFYVQGKPSSLQMRELVQWSEAEQLNLLDYRGRRLRGVFDENFAPSSPMASKTQVTGYSGTGDWDRTSGSRRVEAVLYR